MLLLPFSPSHLLVQWHRCTGLLLKTTYQIDSRRHLRIKRADNTVESGTDPAEKDYRNIDGWARSGSSEPHALDKGGHSLDPQSQNAQSSMRDPKSESPSSIHGRLYKGESTGMGGGERGEQTEAAPPGSWWTAIKDKLPFVARKQDSRTGS